MTTTNSPLDNKRGGALLAVFVIATSMGIILSGILRHSLTERRINERHELRLEAKNASEAIVEFGFAQLKHKFLKQTNFTENALSPGSADELKMPSTALFGAHVDYDASEIYGGSIPSRSQELTFIDPADPANEFDPLKGQKVYTREVALYAKSTVVDYSGEFPIESYVTQRLQVRDSPLFAYAIFYNMDLEVSPGPKMEIHGPVHTNGNLWAQGISGVDFHYPVSSAKDLYYGWATEVGSAQGSGHESLQTGHVRFVNRDKNLVSFKIDSSYRDSNYSNWRSWAANTWHGNLQTQEHGIEIYKPVAFSDYQPDNPSTASYDPVNSGHQLIEPAIPISSGDYVAEVEKQKLSVKAGLRFKWNSETSTVHAYTKGGTELDISNLEGPGSDFLWEVKPSAMYDHRRYQWIDMVEFNMGKLKSLIENPDTTDPAKHIGGYDPFNNWNGIVYFHVTNSSSDSETKARLGYSGIRLWGGDTDAAGQGIPSLGSDPGLTFATNNALYVKGHFNADGVLHDTWTSQNSAIVPEDFEVPVALFGDSVTILSGAWNDAVTSKKPTASSTEVAAAIVSGLIPTNANKNGKSSGGVHNFPRFLEKWSGRSLFIRGSLVALYESENDNSAWRIDYYAPPARNWGFSKLFKDGVYPPGTPLLRTYRRIEYTNLTKAQFEARVSDLPWAESELWLPPEAANEQELLANEEEYIEEAMYTEEEPNLVEESVEDESLVENQTKENHHKWWWWK